MKKFLLKNFPIILILCIAFIARTYRITNPILDWHSFRQADTASVTREYVKHGVDLLHPRYHDLGNIQSGKDNLEGYRMVEFPIINALIAWLILLLPQLSLEVTSRVISILFSLGTLLSLYFLVTKISGKRVGYITLVVGSLLPYYIYYSRAIMPEPAMLFFFVFSLTSFYYWLLNRKIWLYFASLLAAILALLLKPFVIFMFPVFGVIAFCIEGKKMFKNYLLYPFPIIAIIPFIWWRDWIAQFPSGIPANDWLFNGNQIRFRPAWFRWLFFERLTKLILGYTGLIFCFASLYKLKLREVLIYGSWWLGALTYLSIIATGNVQHDYYQVLLVPIIIITVARGIVISQQLLQKYLNKTVAMVVVLSVFAVGLSISWWQIKEYFKINHWEYVEAGAAVQRMTPPDAKVIAPAFGDTLFLYQTDRTGWPIGFEVEDKIKLGATHYITTSYDDEARELEEKYFTIHKTPTYLLLDLTKPKNQ